MAGVVTIPSATVTTHQLSSARAYHSTLRHVAAVVMAVMLVKAILTTVTIMVPAGTSLRDGIFGA